MTKARKLLGWRILPVLAWLALQMGALGAPVHAGAPAEARALFAALDVDRIVICTPEGRKVLTRDGDLGDEAVCLPCKAASLSVSVHGPGWIHHSVSYDFIWRAGPAVELHAVSPARSAFQSRAPPPVRSV